MAVGHECHWSASEASPLCRQEQRCGRRPCGHQLPQSQLGLRAARYVCTLAATSAILSRIKLCRLQPWLVGAISRERRKRTLRKLSSGAFGKDEFALAPSGKSVVRPKLPRNALRFAAWITRPQRLGSPQRNFAHFAGPRVLAKPGGLRAVDA
jgi:hypothetical protein